MAEFKKKYLGYLGLIGILATVIMLLNIWSIGISWPNFITEFIFELFVFGFALGLDIFIVTMFSYLLQEVEENRKRRLFGIYILAILLFGIYYLVIFFDISLSNWTAYMFLTMFFITSLISLGYEKFKELFDTSRENQGSD